MFRDFIVTCLRTVHHIFVAAKRYVLGKRAISSTPGDKYLVQYSRVCSGNFSLMVDEGKDSGLLVERKWSCSVWDSEDYKPVD
jgi:hypothetical protein